MWMNMKKAMFKMKTTMSNNNSNHRLLVIVKTKARVSKTKKMKQMKN